MRRCWDKKEEHVCKNNLDASSLFATHALRHSAPLILRPAAHSLTRLKSRKRLKDRTWAMPPLAWQTQPCASLTRLKSRKRLKDRTWAMPPLAWQTQPCPSLTRLQSRKQKKGMGAIKTRVHSSHLLASSRLATNQRAPLAWGEAGQTIFGVGARTSLQWCVGFLHCRSPTSAARPVPWPGHIANFSAGMRF